MAETSPSFLWTRLSWGPHFGRVWGQSALWGPLLKLTAEAWFHQPGILSIGWKSQSGESWGSTCPFRGFSGTPGPVRLIISGSWPPLSPVSCRGGPSEWRCLSVSQLHLLFPWPWDISAPRTMHSLSALSASGLGPRDPVSLLQTLPHLAHSQASLFPAILHGLTGTPTFPMSCSLRGKNVQPCSAVPPPQAELTVQRGEGTSAGFMASASVSHLTLTLFCFVARLLQEVCGAESRPWSLMSHPRLTSFVAFTVSPVGAFSELWGQGIPRGVMVTGHQHVGPMTMLPRAAEPHWCPL